MEFKRNHVHARDHLLQIKSHHIVSHIISLGVALWGSTEKGDF